jgi:hypothetical protein
MASVLENEMALGSLNVLRSVSLKLTKIASSSSNCNKHQHVATVRADDCHAHCRRFTYVANGIVLQVHLLIHERESLFGEEERAKVPPRRRALAFGDRKHVNTV